MPPACFPGWSAQITPRTAEILELVTRELSIPQATRELACSPATVRTHLDRARRALDLAGIAELRLFWRAHRADWVEDLARRAGVPYAELRDWGDPGGADAVDDDKIPPNARTKFL